MLVDDDESDAGGPIPLLPPLIHDKYTGTGATRKDEESES